MLGAAVGRVGLFGFMGADAMLQRTVCCMKNEIKSPQGLKLRGWEFTAACVLHGDVSDFYLK
jgi:hypothetical protein